MTRKLYTTSCIIALIAALSACSQEKTELISLNWDAEPVEYKHFTDLGHYMLEIKGASVKDIDEALSIIDKKNDNYPKKRSCSGTIKKNSRNEVLMSHSMDVEISVRPGFITRISDGKYDAVMITYTGAASPYKYTSDDMKAMDNDPGFMKTIPFKATDVINEKGLYMAVDMRCGDSESGMDCPGTNPGKTRASTLSAPALIGLNCATVKEALDFLNNSYDWYTVTFSYESGETHSWSMAFLIGDATGEYGLVEFGRNGVYYTPYQNFQSNYYIHPLLSERATRNHGHGRAAALLAGLPDVETEQDIYENQKKARYCYQLWNPSWEYYSDAESLSDVNVRRALPAEEQAAIFVKEQIQAGGHEDNLEKLVAYYSGNENPLREDEMVWMGTITSAVNCAKRHAMFEMWENGTIINIQFKQ